jgi:antitoxin ParD1/3/4
MPIRTINLTDHYDRFVEAQIAGGQYQNAGEVLRAGLRLLNQRAKEDEERLAVLRGLAASAFESLDRGQGIPFEDEQDLASHIENVGGRAVRGVAASPGGE